MQTQSPSRRLVTLLAAAAVGLCAAGAMARSYTTVRPPFFAVGLLDAASSTPMLVAASRQTGGLEYWPISRGGSNYPVPLSGQLNLGDASLVANGDVVFAAMANPPQVLSYNVKTKSQSSLSDPYGTPVDIAIGTDASLYVINLLMPHSNVVWYPKGTGQPQEVTCNLLDLGEQIAVDKEGDVFVQQHGLRRAATDVIEIPNGPSGLQGSKCKKLPLRPETGVAGVTIDPKNDDLITLDHPGSCTGSNMNRMTIYPKPYHARTARSVMLAGNCPGTIRLNADSTIVFYGDHLPSGGVTYIESSTYPAGHFLGYYKEGDSFSQRGPAGFTTIPNSLPN